MEATRPQGSAPRLSRRALIGSAIVGSGALAAGRASGFGIRRLDPAQVGATANRVGSPTPERWWRPIRIGESAEGRPIDVFANEWTGASTSVLVVAAVHGNEPATKPIAESILGVALPPHVNGYVLPCLNPDGWERGTRESANGTDLNRNFPFGWSARDGGAGPGSEPETRALMAFVEAARPALTVFIHQPYGYVGPIHRWAAPQARAWADATGLPLTPGVMQHGGAETWVAFELGLLSILVEVQESDPSVETIDQQRRGYEAMLATL